MTDLYDLIEPVTCDLYMKSRKVEGRDLDTWLEVEPIVTHQHNFAEDCLMGVKLSLLKMPPRCSITDAY
ncbi:MAG TPA: hypothetical protein DCP92_05820 [Nitrospiraceae bacterium]|jgi:hypothetical protein|nr:hypothetical protein [Nitrospiraceae bacterium]